VKVDTARGQVDRDAIAVTNKGQRPTQGRLRRNMADAKTRGGAGEPAIGDERDIRADPGPLDSGGHGDHLRHAGATHRALVADDHDVAAFDPAGKDCLHCRLFVVEYSCFAIEGDVIQASGLHHSAIRGEGAPENGEATRRSERPSGRPHHRTVRSGGRHGHELITENATRHCHRVAMKKTRFLERPQNNRNAADPVQIAHHISTEWLHVGDMRRPPADAIEVLEVQRDAGLCRYSQ
jgi:hypothetical protein